MRRFFDSLSVRLFLFVTGIVALVLSIYVWMNLKTSTRLWVEATSEYATQTSELIGHATYYAMLLNRKDEVHRTIRRLAQQPGIAGIRVYDKQGAIMFSTDDNEIGHRVDLQAEACNTCHNRSEPLHSVSPADRMRLYRMPSGDKVMGLITPIRNQPECYNAACHAHSKNQTILGVLDVKMSMPGLDQTAQATQRQVLLASLLGAGLIALTLGFYIYFQVRRPVFALTQGAKSIAQGDLSVRIHANYRGELGELAGAFNRMTEDLSRARQELTEWSSRLETKVQEKTEELGKSQRQVTQMEKMASLGKLSASVAHELNNPLAGILNYAKLISRELKADADAPDLKELITYLGHIERETLRCGDIVKGLLLFAKKSQESFSEVSAGEIMEQSLMVTRHHLEMANIKFSMHSLPGHDFILCSANEIQQALVALIVNAVEAMKGGGTLTIRAEEIRDKIEIVVRDTGAGISAENIPHIFEPFFTTKEDASGVGLGLAVVYGIIERHKGQIEVSSEIGKGTEFRIVLPRSYSIPTGGYS